MPNSNLREALLDSLEWRCIGPHRGGRVVAVAGDPADPAVFYFGACAGGVWKSTDGGTFWRNISDGFLATSAIGAIAVADADPNVLYVGTGETCIRGNVSHGDGVYKSTDGGKSWTNVGLRDTRHIGKIQIHPANPDLVYVAALGHAFGPNAERGVFRSTDGGQSWQKVHYKSDKAGAHDISMDPNNPRILFAAIWQAQRYPHALESGGPECGLWRTTDGGETWEDISRNPGLPRGVLGKIGVAVSPAQPGRVWALIEAEDGAVFRSDDGGGTWLRLSEESLLRTRPWYYMHITADPRDPDTVWVQNYSLWKSIDGGATFSRVPTPHGDDHALWIDPRNPSRLIEGNDGGACVSYNGGQSWSTIFNQPTAQLYHVITDDRFPYRVYGSQQDNTAISIPSISIAGAIHERDWFEPGGGESGYIAIKPSDPNIIVASGPAGRRAFNDVMTCYDHRTGQRRNITVWPELYGWGVGAESLKYRLQWTFPISYSRHDPNVLYVAGNRLFRSTDDGGSFEVISPDLTRNDPEKLRPSGGPITRDNTGAEVYCTIFALAESPLRAGLLWAGTDDGLVHISRDGGRTWANVTPPDLPEWALISIVEASPHDDATAYVAATRYKLDDTRPYLYQTHDYGRTWTKIVDGIPDDDFTRVIREDPNRRGLLYAGTETGLYVSLDDGARWRRLGGNLPVVPIYDLTIKGVELVVATHGRSFWILDDLTPLHQLTDEIAGRDFYLFRPRPTVRLRFRAGRGRQPVPGMVNYGKADTSTVAHLPVRQSDGTIAHQHLDAGENPPQGVVVQYFLSRPPAAEAALRFLDADGRELRVVHDAPAAPGMNRFTWNLRLPGATDAKGARLMTWQRPDGPMVLPGSYRVELTVDGEQATQSFQILPDPRIAATDADLAAQYDLLIATRDALSRTNELINSVELMREQTAAWQRWAADHERAPAIREAAEALDAQLLEIERGLIDVTMWQSQLWPSGLHEKLNALFDAVDSADYAPTRQSREVFAMLGEQLEMLTHRLDRATAERAAALNRIIREAGIPPVGVVVE